MTGSKGDPVGDLAGDLASDLDRIEAGAGDVLRRARARAAFAAAALRAAPLRALIPASLLALQLMVWGTGGSPDLLPLPVLLVAVLLAPRAAGAWAARAALGGSISRRRALGEADRQLDLADRMVTADEFLAAEERTPFQQAAVEDAAARSARAADAALAAPAADAPGASLQRRWAAAAVVLVGLSAWVATLEPRPSAGGDPEAALAAAPGAPVEEGEEREADPGQERAAPEAPEAEPDRRRPDDPSEAQRSESGEDVDDSVKESSGKTGAGRSSGALSSSAASESRSAPSTQGQSSKPAERDRKKPASKKKKEREADEQPIPERRPEDEQSGATAGKGSSKGSNRNPTASEWQSRDQVTEVDEQEIEDDEDTDDDEEEQENRGGVQPSLRDRRPPVSRDLQIGFGNRPNPDANGRGGPSEQKKSRGVASLVLGVPIPDRVKGRPGPGPTKITQERIEPQAEEAGPVEAALRTPRSRPGSPLSSVDLGPQLRELVRAYFLARRAAAPPRQ
ncbi:MAG: hypothetical protein PVJ89_08915 [Planctomycetota bacterium]